MNTKIMFTHLMFAKNYFVMEILMWVRSGGWTENDKIKKVKEWKNRYGHKKKALGLAAQKLETIINSDEYKRQFADNHDSVKSLAARENFSSVLKGFADLHVWDNR